MYSHLTLFTAEFEVFFPLSMAAINHEQEKRFPQAHMHML